MTVIHHCNKTDKRHRTLVLLADFHLYAFALVCDHSLTVNELESEYGIDREVEVLDYRKAVHLLIYIPCVEVAVVLVVVRSEERYCGVCSSDH